MIPKKTNHDQGELFEARLSKLLNPHHPLLFLAELIDWESIEKEIEGAFDETHGAPGKPIRLVAGILMLQHMSGLSDEETVRGWVENPYWQRFCGYDFLQWKFPLDPSSLSRWRKRIGEKGVKTILRATIECAIRSKIISECEFASVIVDTTVMPKAIAFPTDARLYYKSLIALVRLSNRLKIKLRQTYKFVSKRAFRQSCSYAHARKIKAARKEVRKLRTYLGRVLREIETAITEKNKELQRSVSGLLKAIRGIYDQKREDKGKTYSVHEPNVECISKGKAHKKYEFGCKVSIVATHKIGLVLNSEAVHENPFDGHTLKESIANAEEISKRRVKKIFVDKGYKGHGVKDKCVYISGTRKLSYHFKKLLKRRQSIEPRIGHMKQDGKLERNFLKGHLGDKINAILCGVGNNIRLILRSLKLRFA